MNISELINFGSKELKSNKIISHRLDSEVLLSEILKTSRENLIVNSDNKVKSKFIINFKKLIKRRISNEPIAYIIKKKEFWSKNFFVKRGVLIPRPETELLIELIVKKYKNKNFSPYILDIGTGSGCILLSILSEIKNSEGVGIDISKNALEIAKKNSKELNLIKRVKFYQKSIEEIFVDKFDLIVSNPPYIPRPDIKNLSKDIKKFEPQIALDGGNDGLDVIRKVIYNSRTILKKLGTLGLEIGNGQYYKVSQILKKHGFREEAIIEDYQNNIRCILAKLKID
jgi:release factor glutamine methyltransferase